MHYILDPLDYDRLRIIMNRLFDDRPLSGDQRRDLANAMYAVLEGVEKTLTGATGQPI